METYNTKPLCTETRHGTTGYSTLQREGAHGVVGLTLKMAMEVDGEFSSLMCPEYDAGFAGLTVKELSSRLQKSGFAFNHCDILEGKVL